MGLAGRLTDVGIDRFGICQAVGCPGVFIDTSTSKTRRYCSERCMNRANVSAYRARRRGEDEGDANTPSATVERATVRLGVAARPFQGILAGGGHYIPMPKRNVELFGPTS